MLRRTATRYGGPVTALWSFDEQPRTGDPLLPGAAPAAIRDALLPDDQAAFDDAYQDALTQARESLELTELFRTLRQRHVHRAAAAVPQVAGRTPNSTVKIDS